MNNDEPLAFFITWTVYGTWLQGDVRGWKRRMKGHQKPQPLLADWRRDRLKHAIVLLNVSDREAVNAECQRLSNFRGWHLWKVNARTNHVHAVVTARGFAGDKVRDQLKANCTRVLRECRIEFHDRPVWTTGGDWDCINAGDDLEAVIQYASEAQDHYPDQPPPSAAGR